MRRALKSTIVAGAVPVLMCGGVFPAAATTTSPSPSSGSSAVSGAVPVLGRTVISPRGDSSGPAGIGLVHGVRRVPGGTVLYYSLGFPVGTSSSDANFFNLNRSLRTNDRFNGPDAVLAKPVVYDVSGRMAYTTLVDTDGQTPLCSAFDAIADRTAGRAYVLYTLLPELPATTTDVDVELGFGNVVPHVPVEDGLMTPALPADSPILLGTGFPKIDEAKLAGAPDKQKSAYPLSSAVSDLEKTVVTREETDQVQVDLAADVLFAVDQATLTAAAKAKITEAAATVNQRSAGGRIEVTGHTDNTGSDTYNRDLSRRRAAAVEAVLRPLVTVPGVQFVIAGRGESEPVADNRSAEGRQQNRRVSVAFTPKDAQ